MKRGFTVARRRFWNKYGKVISNSILSLSIVLFMGVLSLSIYANNIDIKNAKANYEITTETKEVLSVKDNVITTIDDMTYKYQNAENKMNSLKNETNMKWEVLIVDNEVVSIIGVYN